MLVLCFSESSLKYSVKHPGPYVGICGVTPVIWRKHLNQNEISINSLVAGEEILNFYLDKNNGDVVSALLDYKGAKTNKKIIKIVHKILEIEGEL